jgi:threonine synthase
LDEGGTPCKISEKIGHILDLHNLSFKNETINPTNSFKDRAGAMLISHARSWGYQKVICASNGNQGASIAAYASVEGMDCLNIIPSEIDVGKKAQMIAYNSDIITYGKTVDESINYVLKPEYDQYYQCTPEFNSLTIEAQKTIAFEIYLQQGNPDWIVIPMGSGELLISIWKGFKELLETKLIERVPRIIGVQSKVSAPIVNDFLGKKRIKNVEDDDISSSIALGVFVKSPIYKDLAIKCIKESEGTVVAIPESLILRSTNELMMNERIVAEPASALTLAAIYELINEDIFQINDKIICIITGSGLKVPYILEALSSRTKTAGMGTVLSTKLKILSQISLSSSKGIYGKKIKEIIGNITLAAIYQHLKDLENNDLISRKREGKNVLYYITKRGKRVLEALDTLISLL